MTPLTTERLIIRNWEDRDRGLFHLINSDEQVMRYFPFRRTRAESDAMLDSWRRDIADNGYGFTALALRDTGACIGCCGIKHPNVMPFLPEEAIEIGWRLAPEFWGKGYITEAADCLLGFGFDTLSLPEIVSFAVANNARSTAIMERLGMRRDEAGDFDHPRVPDTHPALKRHALYRMKAEDWRQRKRPQ